MKHKKFILTLAVLCVFASNVFAHPPKVVSPSYNPKTGELTVDIVHTTTNHELHFAYRIEIFVNDKKVKEDDTLTQDNSTGSRYTTSLRGVKNGDHIKVTVSCNRWGAKSGEIIAGEKSGVAAVKKEAEPKQEEKQKENPKKKKGFFDTYKY